MSDHALLGIIAGTAAVAQVGGLVVLALQLRETRREVRDSLREVRKDSRRMVRAIARLMTGHNGKPAR